MRRVLFIALIVLALLVAAGVGVGVVVGTPTRPAAAVTLGERGGDNTTPAEDLSIVERAEGLLEGGDAAGARALLEARLDEDPGDADAVVLLGRCYMELGDPAQASVLIEQAVDADPENAGFRYWYASAMGQEAMTANTLAQMNLGMRAMEQYNTAIGLDPDHIETRRALMFAALFAPSFIGGGEARARMHADEIARVDEREGNIAYAQLAARNDAHAEAVSLFDAALAAEGPALDPQTQTQYVRALYDAGETGRAFAAARSLVERGDVGIEGLYQLGRLSALSGEHGEEGLASLRRYAGHGEGNIPEAYVRWRMAQVLIHLGREDEARGALETALELEPGMDEAIETLKTLD